jgi:hypothetical protein
MCPFFESAHSHGRHRDINVIYEFLRTQENGHQRATQHLSNAFCCLRPSVSIEAVDLIDAPTKQPRRTKRKRGQWLLEMMCSYARCDGRLGGVNATINLLRPRFNSIGNWGDGFEAMGGGNVTINWVEGGHRRREKGGGQHNKLWAEACLKPSAIDTESKDSGQRIVCQMKTWRDVNTNEQQSMPTTETGFANMFADSTSCFYLDRVVMDLIKSIKGRNIY